MRPSQLNRRYADPSIPRDGSIGPVHFEGDSFHHLPYAKHVRRFDYGVYPHPPWDYTIDGREVNKRFNCYPTTDYNIVRVNKKISNCFRHHKNKFKFETS